MQQPYLRYLIVDDKEIDRLYIETQAARHTFLKKQAICTNALEALEIIRASPPDILFADIEMPGITGMELVRAISAQVPVIIFITSHPEFALEGFEMEVFDFISKPIDTQRFNKCIHRVQEFWLMRKHAFAFEQQQHPDNFIVVKQRYDKFRIHINNILYLESLRNYTKIVTVDITYLVLETLSSLHGKLAEAAFLRVHRSFVINRDKIDAVTGSKLIIGKEEIPVGKLYKNILQEISF